MKQYKIIDAHAHIFPQKILPKAVDSIGAFYTLPMSGGKGSAEDLLEQGKKIGVCNYVVHSVATVPTQVEHINDFIAAETRLHPEFIGFASLHPGYEKISEEVQRAIELGLRGIKLHPDFQKFDIDSPEALEMYRKIDGRLPILMHMGDRKLTYSKPERLARVLEMFPKQVFIAAHLGGYSAWEESKQCLIGKNIFIDTCSALPFLSAQEAAEIIRAHGTKRVFFGTDYPMWQHEEELERFLALPLTEQEREDILFNNAAALLGVE